MGLLQEACRNLPSPRTVLQVRQEVSRLKVLKRKKSRARDILCRQFAAQSSRITDLELEFSPISLSSVEPLVASPFASTAAPDSPGHGLRPRAAASESDSDAMNIPNIALDLQ